MLDLAIGIISFALTIMVFSYILGDNFFFKLAVYLLVGVSSGYTTVVLISKVIIPYLIRPVIDGSWQERLLALVPLVLSLLLVAMIIPRLTKAGSIPMAILVGIISALTIGGVTLGTIVPQMLGTINLFSSTTLYQNDGQTWIRWADAVIMLIGVITTLLYFHFGLPKKESKDSEIKRPYENIGKIGQIFIGITLGALFAGIYSTALMALISRISEIRDFISQLFGS